MRTKILFFVLNFFLLSFAFADNGETPDLAEKNQSKKGIYFCTRDVEEDISGSPAVITDEFQKEAELEPQQRRDEL